MNHSQERAFSQRIIFGINALGAVISGGFGVAAMLDPGLVLPGTDVSAAVDIYAWAYGARAVPLAVAVLILLTTQAKRGLIPLLLVSGAAQLGDAIIGATRGNPGMLFGGTSLAIIHWGTVLWLSRRPGLARVSP